MCLQKLRDSEVNIANFFYRPHKKRVIKCDYCGHETSSFRIRNHILEKHADQLDPSSLFECEICFKKFLTKGKFYQRFSDFRK